MRTKFLTTVFVLIVLAFVFASCSSQKTGCVPEKMKRTTIKFKGFL